MSNLTRMMLAYPMFPSLSQVKSVEALRRHFQHALDYGTNPMAAEYLKEIERRETETEKEAA